MVQFVNQASYLFAALALLAAATAGALLLHGSALLRAGLVLAVALVLLALPIALRTGPGVASAAEIEGLIGGGTPVLLELYSDF